LFSTPFGFGISSSAAGGGPIANGISAIGNSQVAENWTP
jgi:hypothetical protein